jgi:chromosomal replication initiator protein
LGLLASSENLSILVDGAAVIDVVFSIPLVADLPVDEFEIEPNSRADTRPRNRVAANDDRAASPRMEFLAGPENRLLGVAIAALLDERQPRYNPLVIHGPSGAGKTHLARGLAAKRSSGECPESQPVVFTTCADFARLLADAIDGRATSPFRERYRGASLLILDDLTALATKRVAQQELIHTLDAVIDGGGQGVITSRTPPDRITTLLPALQSRLAAGLTVSLVLPEAAARLALIERFASSRRTALPFPAARTLADGLPATAAELSGALMQLHWQASRDGSSIDAARVRRFLADCQLRLRPSLRTIVATTAKYYGLRMGDLTGPSRRRGIAQGRAAAMYLARDLTGKSLTELGTYFGRRDHTTVLHSVRLMESRLTSDPATKRAIADLRKLIAQA